MASTGFKIDGERMNYSTSFEDESLAEYWCYIWNKHYTECEHLIQEKDYINEDGSTVTEYHVVWRKK